MAASLLAVLLFTACSIDASSIHAACGKGKARVYSFAQSHRRAFLKHGIDYQGSERSAFTSPCCNSGVAASLFNHNFLWKRRRTLQSSNVLVNHKYIRGKYCGLNIFMGQTSTALDKDQSGISEPGASPRSQQVLQSLQGGVDVSEEVVIADYDEHSSSDEESSDNTSDEDDKDTKLSIHIYPHDDQIHNDDNSTTVLNETNNITLLYKQAMIVGLGVSRSQFAMGVYYHVNHLQNNDINHSGNASSIKMQLTSITRRIQTHKVDWESVWPLHRPTLLDLWKQERLFCESTGLLSPKKFRQKQKVPREGAADCNSEGDIKREEREDDIVMKGENFSDALSSYSERFVSIVDDERSDVHHIVARSEETQSNQSESNLPKWNDSRGLLGWVEQEYGSTLMASSLLLKSESEQLKVCYQMKMLDVGCNNAYHHIVIICSRNLNHS